MFAIVKTNEIENVLQTINNTTKNIVFAKKDKNDNQLAFLDVLLTKKDDGTLKTQVYRKNTNTDQILNYNSNHPTVHKISGVKSLYSTVSKHTATPNKPSEMNETTSTKPSSRTTTPKTLSIKSHHRRDGRRKTQAPSQTKLHKIKKQHLYLTSTPCQK